MTSDILCPDCPECGQPPMSTAQLPYFCDNDECSVIAWDPERTLTELWSTVGLPALATPPADAP